MTTISRLRNPGSAITHFIALILALMAAAPLIFQGYVGAGFTGMLSMSVFMASMVLLYGASTLYHSVNFEGERLKIFKRLDHTMIFVLIAGSYTPLCLLALSPASGRRLLVVIWTLAVIGIIVKLFFIMCPTWFSSVLYTAMGWACLSVIGELRTAMTEAGFFWLFLGGILYTVGAVIYALKLPAFNARHKNFGTHEIFHLFVMGGSFCHFLCMYQLVC